jgi:hypothetical protein
VTTVAGSSGVLAGIIGERELRSEPPAVGEMAAILEEAVRRHAGPPMKIRRYESDEGPAFWRWDCSRCGEYGGGRHHSDAMTRALRHCAEHPEHRSSLLPPMRCAEDREPPAPVVHPMLFAVDDDPPPAPLAI